MEPDEFTRAIAEMSADYRRSLTAKLDRLDTLRRKVTSRTSTAHDIREMYRELHTIAGTAHAFGLPEVSKAARMAESLLAPYYDADAKAVPQDVDRARLDQLIEALNQSRPGPVPG